MTIKNGIARVAIMSVAAGSLLVAGLAGATTVSADGPQTQGQFGPMTPSFVQTETGWAKPPVVTQAIVGQTVTNQVAYNAYVAAYYNSNRYAAFQSLWPHFGYSQSSLPYYVSNGVVSYNAAQSASIVAASAQVFNLPVQSVTNALAQGRSLAQIAAERGWTRANFVNAVNNVLNNNISAAINAGTISQPAGQSLYFTLSSQVNVAIDVHGYPVGLNANVLYYIYR